MGQKVYIQCYDDKFSYQTNVSMGSNSKSSGRHTADFYSMQSEYGKTKSALDLGLTEFKVKKQNNVKGKMN